MVEKITNHTINFVMVAETWKISPRLKLSYICHQHITGWSVCLHVWLFMHSQLLTFSFFIREMCLFHFSCIGFQFTVIVMCMCVFLYIFHMCASAPCDLWCTFIQEIVFSVCVGLTVGSFRAFASSGTILTSLGSRGFSVTPERKSRAAAFVVKKTTPPHAAYLFLLAGSVAHTSP